MISATPRSWHQSLDFRKVAWPLPEAARDISRPLLLDGEHPDDAALRHVILQPDIIAGRQCVLDALRVDAPARLDGDIFRPIDFIRDRHAHDAGVGLLL